MVKHSNISYIFVLLVLLASCAAHNNKDSAKTGGIAFNADYERVWDASRRSAAALDWIVVSEDKDTGRIVLAPSYVYRAEDGSYKRIYARPSKTEIVSSDVSDYLQQISYLNVRSGEGFPVPLYSKENLIITVSENESDDITYVSTNYHIEPRFCVEVPCAGKLNSRGVIEESLYSEISAILAFRDVDPPIPPRVATGVYRLQDIFFDFDRHDLRRDAIPVLYTNLEKIRNEPATDIVVRGYADIRGPSEYNKRLSRKRAESVKKFLVDNGINHRRIIAIGEGETTRFAPGTSEDEYQLNRRASFIPVRFDSN